MERGPGCKEDVREPPIIIAVTIFDKSQPHVDTHCHA
ncbi:hypothetical protein TNCV_1930501, partial [Trichonephila clavipes]